MQKYFKQLIFITLIIAIINCGGLKYQQGTSSDIKQGGEHILETQTDVNPRELVIRVDFEQEFEAIPQVILSLRTIIWNNNVVETTPGASFNVQLDKVDTTGFSYKVTVEIDRPFNEVEVYWLAYVDPHIQQETYEIKVFGINGNSEKSTYNFPIEFERTFVSPPNVSTFILGTVFNEDGGAYDVYVEPENITNEGCDIAVGAFNDGNPYSVHVQVVILPNERSDVVNDFDTSSWNLDTKESQISERSSRRGGRGPSRSRGDYNSKQGDSNEKEFVTSFKPKMEYYEESNLIFLGISGFNSPYGDNFRVTEFQNVFIHPEEEQQATKNKFKIKIKTNTTTNLENASFSWFGYEVRDDCAFLFSSCNFSGNGIAICADAAKNSFAGTHLEDNDIRSIYVPQDQELTLYDEENLEGRTATFTKSEECLKEIEADDE